MTSVRNRVTRGAALLDRLDPEWFNKVDLAIFDLTNYAKCALGQVAKANTDLDSWSDFLEWAFKDEDVPAADHYAFAAEHGFAVAYGVMDSDQINHITRQTTKAWGHVIRERRSMQENADEVQVTIESQRKQRTYESYIITFADGTSIIHSEKDDATNAFLLDSSVVKLEAVRVAVIA